MATEFENPRTQTVPYTRNAGGVGVAIAIIVLLVVGAMLFFTFNDRTPQGSSATSSPGVVKTAPPTNTAPSTK